MQQANRHLKSWQSAELKSLKMKLCKRQDLERIWQAPKRKKQIELDVASHANALPDLYHDDAAVQTQDSTTGIADTELFQWYRLSDELHAMASNKSSDTIGLITEMFKKMHELKQLTFCLVC